MRAEDQPPCLTFDSSLLVERSCSKSIATAHRCEGVFETLNMITRMLLHKFVSQGTPQYA